MFEWIETIFSETSDKARFITVLFSAVVAVLILLLTQFFISKRNRRQLLIQKVEELYKATLDYQKYGNEYLSILHFPPHDNEMSRGELDILEKTSNSAQTITMLMELYFSNVPYSKSETEAMILTLRGKLEYKSKDGDDGFDLYHEIRDEFDVKINVIKNICRKLSQNV